MDPATLATTVLAVLTPYLVKARGKLAEEVGGSLPEHAGKLWLTLVKKFKGKPAAEQAITDLAKEQMTRITRRLCVSKSKRLSKKRLITAGIGGTARKCPQGSHVYSR